MTAHGAECTRCHPETSSQVTGIDHIDHRILINVGVYLRKTSDQQLSVLAAANCRLSHRAPRFCEWLLIELQQEVGSRQHPIVEAEPLRLPTDWAYQDYAGGAAVVLLMLQSLTESRELLLAVGHGLAQALIMAGRREVTELG
jgi:hypothetical protein